MPAACWLTRGGVPHPRASPLALPAHGYTHLYATPPPLPPTDIYVFCCSYSHNVAPRDKWIAFVSTTVETADPQAELAPGGRRGCGAVRAALVAVHPLPPLV